MSVHSGQEPDSGQARPPRRLQLDEATALGDRVLAWLCEQRGCGQASAVGALRRRHEVFDGIELLVATSAAGDVLSVLASAPGVATVAVAGRDRATLTTVDGARITVHTVPPARYVDALHQLTGSRAYVRALGAPGRTGAASEEDLYAGLGLPHVPPELRDGTAAVEAARAGTLPRLIEVADIRGDLHAHTTASDGEAGIEDMARAAQARGYGYLAITEHTPAVDVMVDEPIGVDPGRLRDHVAAIREVAARLAGEGFTLLAGAEVDILPDGSLDYPDDVLEALDWVVASPHVALRQRPAAVTARMVAAAAHPHVDVIGHPTGRYLIGRRPSAVAPEALVAACAEHGTFLEINANPERLDLSARNVRLAHEAGVPIVISTDAHALGHFANICFGVSVARRAWLSPADVVNTRSWADVQALRKPARRR
jgi:DNA polymerase (family 10)